jgi:hypothetical protein
MRLTSLAVALALAAAPSRCIAADESARSAAALDPTVAAPAARPPPDLRARPIEVVGLAGLFELGPDPEVEGRTRELRSRRTLGIVSFVGAATAFVLGGVLYTGETVMNATENAGNAMFCGSRPGCQKDPDYTPAYISYGIAAGLAIIGLVVWPREREYAETVALWNARNPSRPAEWVGWVPRPAPEDATTPGAAPPAAGPAPTPQLVPASAP